MTDLQVKYAEHRNRGRGHTAAIIAVANETDMTERDVSVALSRARVSDEREPTAS